MGSQVSFVCESLVTVLNLHRTPCELQVEGIDQSISTRTKGMVGVSMQSHADRQFQINFNAYVIDSITSMTPATTVDTRTNHHLRGLHLADSEFATPGSVELLIGADLWPSIVLNDVIVGSNYEPCALHTRLGWVVLGPVAANVSEPTSFSYLAGLHDDDSSTDHLLRKFWEIEEPVDIIGPEVDACEEIFVNTVTRHTDGRYIVQIPFRADAPQLGNSHPAALRQFLKLERTLANDYTLRNKYIQFMREYFNLGHMEAIGGNQVDLDNCYYIPHHAVMTKFRVVFNASSKTTNGVSLNDTQMCGSQLQDNLVDILHRFRRYSIALTADIRKMFRQVTVDSRHRKWQQILWRESPKDPLRTYQLKTVTYGMASGPFNAIRTLRQCAYDNWEVIADVSRGAAARDSILHSFYVDDYLESVHTTELAINRAHDVDAILQQGKFELDKWNSNCVQTLEGISGSKAPASEINFSDSSTTVLGLRWNPITDTLFFKVKVCNFDTVPTKRIVLSDIARLYDPLGMLAPVVVTAKIFVQNLWLAKLNWDTPLPFELCETWMKYRNSLQALERIKISRWLGIRENSVTTLHGFCDASTKAYAAVIYLRNTSPDGESNTALVAAKTRVAPLKEMTIPRLELSAAQLLVTTMNNIRRALQLEDTAYTLWSDSTIVLHWIRRQPSSLKQYVANRIASIQAKSDVSAWRHIRSEYNPADCASRGITSVAIGENELWWKGPPLIHAFGDSSSSPLPNLTVEQQQILTGESRPLKVHLGAGIGTGLLLTSFRAERIPLVARFSRLSALLNTTARIRRFIPSLRSQRSNEVITAEEKEWALIVHIRQSQGNMYLCEIRALKSHSSIDSSSKLLPLNPILDEEGILRVGGRLTNSELPYEQKHPMILANTCSLAKLLVADAHKCCLHGGIQEMLQYLRMRFWILHARQMVKSYLHQCVVCRRHARVTQQQQMSSLPRSRVTVTPPFTHTGLDYCGPFNVRHGGKRSTTISKTYGAIFICMATKAVHIELAENLSTQAFIDVFDRFISRRGICSVLYSDNGTQFVGASRVMNQDLQDWRNVYATQHIASSGTQWKFITPAAPHHGGLWEAAVRSAKKHLYRTIGRQILRFNQLSTLLVRIEACLNSRPLIPLHDDPSGSFALTPGDFLIGRPINSRPEPPVADIPENRILYSQQLQKMFEHFWNRWNREYLSSLQARRKWERRRENLQQGDIVLIQNENLPPTHWRIGRITEVHPGDDGLVRIVSVEYNSDKRTPEGLFLKHHCQRPVQKICRLIDPNPQVLNPDGSAGEEC